MKKIAIVAVVIAVFAIGMAASSYAATDQTSGQTLKATVGEVFSLGFSTTAAKFRSTTGSVEFKTADGTAPNGWYYNKDATLDGSGDPSDGKSDVGILCKSNAHTGVKPFYLKITKAVDALDDAIGYAVTKKYDAGAATETEADGTLTASSGFKSTTTWGVLKGTLTVYQSGTNIYAQYGVLVPMSFVLVPGNTAAGTVTSTITYTMVAPV